MLRAIVTLGGTAAGLAALLAFKTHAPASAPTALATSTPAGMSPRTGAAAAGGMTGAKMSAGASPAATRMVTGAVANTDHGPMQVQLTLAGKRITKVTVLQRTNDGSESVR